MLNCCHYHYQALEDEGKDPEEFLFLVSDTTPKKPAEVTSKRAMTPNRTRKNISQGSHFCPPVVN